MTRLKFLVAGLFLTLATSVWGQALLPYQDSSLPFEERIADLIGRMTLEQKVSQMVHTSAAIPELGIPAYNWWNEALHGVGRAGEATVFPQAIAMAAAFDEEMMQRIGTAISDEARAKYHDFARHNKRGSYQGLTFWMPNINIFRDPRWGRGQETYGEDPYLTGRLSVGMIKGMQGDDPKYLKTVATAKHFAVHSGPEPLRHEFDARTSVKDLWETYLPAFEMAVTEAHVEGIMCAYSSYQGEACCASKLLQEEILRGKWHFGGHVVSDCWALRNLWQKHKVAANAVEGVALALKRGTDLNCGNAYKNLIEAVKKGYVEEKYVDRALARVMMARFKLGMFDADSIVPYARIPLSVIGCDKHRALALEAARKSVVLLKNDNRALPLAKNIRKVAVIGPVADDEETLWGNYCGYSKEGVTVLQGIRNKLPDAEIVYEVGCELSDNFPQLEPIPAKYLWTDSLKSMRGLQANYFANDKAQGEPAYKTVDQEVNFTWWNKAPDGLNPDGFSAVWEGYVEAPETGRFAIGGEGFYRFKMWVNDSLTFDYFSLHHPRKHFTQIDLKKGELTKIRIEYCHRIVSHALMKLYWARPMTPAVEQRAVDAAKAADLVVLCMGINQNMEGEEMQVAVDGFKGGDRTDIRLPQSQQRLMRRIQALGKKVVLVLLSGSPISCTWEQEHFDAIVEGWYGGQSAGTAIADVLFGDYNPSGRLPVTVYKSLDQVPDFQDYSMAGRTYRYFQGTPLYEFGYGLSFTNYAYSDLTMPKSISPTSSFTVSVDVANDGGMDGEEVVQLYVTNRNTTEQVPIRSLRGFKRVQIPAGQSRRVTFALKASDLAFVNANGKRVIAPGEVLIGVGGRQPLPQAIAEGHAVEKTITIKGQERVLSEATDTH